jgi:hypothetical protein
MGVVELTRGLEVVEELFVWKGVVETASMAVILGQENRVYPVYRYI